MSLFGYWYLPDLAAAQQKLCASAASTDAAVQSCASLDAATKTLWSAWYANAQTFCVEVPVWIWASGPHDVLATGAFVDRLELLQKELYAWQQRLSAKCALAPVVDQAQTSFGLGDPATQKTVQFVAGAAAVVAAAYLGTKVVALVPSAKLRARTARERERTARHALRRS